MVTEWQREQQERQARLQQLARDVAPHLAGFTYVEPAEDYPYGRVTQDNAMGFELRGARTPDRATISGVWPVALRSTLAYGRDIPSITVAVNRPPAAIARDIERRFLSDYRAVYAQCLDRHRADEQHRAETRDTTCRLAAAAGIVWPDKQTTPSDEQQTLHLRQTAAGLWGQVRICGTSAKIELGSVPVDIAERIVRVAYEVAGDNVP